MSNIKTVECPKCEAILTYAPYNGLLAHNGHWVCPWCKMPQTLTSPPIPLNVSGVAYVTTQGTIRYYTAGPGMRRPEDFKALAEQYTGHKAQSF